MKYPRPVYWFSSFDVLMGTSMYTVTFRISADVVFCTVRLPQYLPGGQSTSLTRVNMATVPLDMLYMLFWYVLLVAL